jgi:putative DNA primase/helicase
MNDLNVEGITAELSGEKYIVISDENLKAIVPLIAFHHNGAEAIGLLREYGFPIIGTSACSDLISRIANRWDFPTQPIIERIGWNGGYFALPNGEIIAPPDAPPIELAIPVDARSCFKVGDFAGWKEGVAKPAKDHLLLQFALMVMLTAPLLRLSDRFDNFGFEIVGRKGRGKSTLLRLMCSVAGGIGGGSSENHYYRNFHTTLNGLEPTMARHADLPLCLEEANLFAVGGSSRALSNKLKDAVFVLGSGASKDRFGSPTPATVRTVYFLTTNDSFAEVVGTDSESARAGQDRLLTIPLGEDRPHSWLDSVPDGYADAGEFVGQLVSAAARNHGHALPLFLRGLVNDLAADEAGLKEQIGRYVGDFRRRANIDPTEGSPKRVAEAFGLVYAAGELARRYGVLPKKFRCGPAAMAAYRIHLGNGRATSFKDRIQQIAAGPQVRALGKGKLPELTDDEMAVGIFSREGRNGLELLIDPDRIREVITDWPKSRAAAKSEGCLIVEEEGRDKVKRRVSTAHPAGRLFGFFLR